MARPILLTSIATVVFLLSSVPVQGRVTLQSRASKGIAELFLNIVTQWLWTACGIAIIATIFLGILFIFSIKAFYMHRKKHPYNLFSREPVGDARTGQVFCTLVVLSLFFLTAYFPMFIVFIVLPSQKDSIIYPYFTIPLTYMAINLGNAFAAGALLALISHRRYLHFRRGEMLWKRILDIAIVAFMMIFIAIWTVLYCLPSTYESTSNTALKVGQAMGHLNLAFFALAIVDIFVSTAFFWQKLRKARIHDQVRKS